jgi:virulence factor Mce-like protein
MTRRQGLGIATTPVLVGAVTVLVTIIAVFIAYNANSGLPFVPTYDLKASVPNASGLVNGNDVRIGGARVGVISGIKAVPDANGRPRALLTMKLDNDLKPLPVDSTFLVRSRSALGLKYLEVQRGRAKAGYQEGARVPLRQARPSSVELDQVLEMFDNPTREGARRTLNGLGTGFAGRGADLNLALGDLRPLLADLEPVSRNLSDPSTRLGRLFTALGDTAAEVAPVADQQAALFANLDTTFSALARVARPFLQQTISRTPPTLDTGIAELPRQRPFLRNTAAFMRELRPGVATLPRSAPLLADAVEAGARNLPRTPPLNRRLADLFDRLARFSGTPSVRLGIHRLTETVSALRPTVAFLTPVQTTCNYVSLFLRNASSLLSLGHAGGTWQRFIVISSPQGRNNEGSPSAAPANGPEPANHLHANPYPNTASPGEPKECEAGNEGYLAGRTLIGNVPGNQGARTEGQSSGGRR